MIVQFQMLLIIENIDNSTVSYLDSQVLPFFGGSRIL